MKTYNGKIALIRNNRGVYCIDSIMGCASGMAAHKDGCYGDCYAARTARRYGIDFSKSVLRDFENEGHKAQIMRQIEKIKMPFIRLGASGDPSEDWSHTLKILRVLKRCNTEIVIITRHWTLLSDEQIGELSAMNMCINTSVSALDSKEQMHRSVEQFKRLSPHLKSVLRIVSCDFNKEHPEGKRMADEQRRLFELSPTIDTVFRPSNSNPLVTSGIVKTSRHFFNGKKQVASKWNPKAYMGKCGTCQEMCGVNCRTQFIYANRPGVERQELLPI